MTLPGYDAWLTRDPRDRDYAPCTCGHDFEEHEPFEAGDICHGDAACACTFYDEQEPPERDPDEKWDRRHE